MVFDSSSKLIEYLQVWPLVEEEKKQWKTSFIWVPDIKQLGNLNKAVLEGRGSTLKHSKFSDEMCIKERGQISHPVYILIQLKRKQSILKKCGLHQSCSKLFYHKNMCLVCILLKFTSYLHKNCVGLVKFLLIQNKNRCLCHAQNTSN